MKVSPNNPMGTKGLTMLMDMLQGALGSKGSKGSEKPGAGEAKGGDGYKSHKALGKIEKNKTQSPAKSQPGSAKGLPLKSVAPQKNMMA